ncbi:MAG: sigma-E processing peptidase SpoIIGA [Lachnospiraceae bacterium]|nr:sigma-E processing peptidase SpoIIGA [Lachnospiraceae bacterium]
MSMKITLYPDLILAINLLADITILYLTARLTRQPTAWWRLLLAGGFGSAVSLVILILRFHGIIVNYAVSVLAVEILMITIAFSVRRVRQLILLCGCHMVCAVLLHGILYMVLQAMHIEYLPVLMLACLILWLLYQGYERYRSVTHDSSQIYTGLLYWEERSILGQGFVDTGNTLIDPVSGRFVVIVDGKWIQPLLPPAYQEIVGRYLLSGSIDYAYITAEHLYQVRVIPYRTIGEEEGTMLAIQCRKLVISNQEESYKYAPAVIGISRTSIRQGEEYQMILPNRR